MPQFAATYPDRADYQRPWRDWPDEIPDSFVREFGTWCAEQGVKGKYSVVPYPACVGWLDRTLPGWSQQELENSLQLVRELLLPNWDIHPEMISHTRVIDLKHGRPFADFSPAHMENTFPQEDVSVDYLASYLAYALRILKNCDLPCEGITTPGGFGNRVKEKLPLAVWEAVRDVFGTEIPHYFKYVSSGDESVEPKVEALRGADSASPSLVMNIPAGTGDWFGGWDGANASQGDRYCDASASSGRMVELIERRQPAIMLCHWPGLYSNGSKAGFHDFQKVVLSLHERFAEQVQWMKISDIGKYWAARELTSVRRQPAFVELEAPFACADFTLRVPGYTGRIRLHAPAGKRELGAAPSLPALQAGKRISLDQDSLACWDLEPGRSRLELLDD